MREFSRVLAPKGRIILFEPAALSLLGRFIYGYFHHEQIHASGPIKWHIPDDKDPKTLPYYAAQGNAWKMFSGPELPHELKEKWQKKHLRNDAALDWLAAGDFERPSSDHQHLALYSRAYQQC